MEPNPRFGGIVRLYGREAVERLRRAHVCVVGVGGVGSWTVEALARSGVGALTLVDADEVCVTNINRQLPALEHTVGVSKVRVLAERVAAIHAECEVRAVEEFFTAASGERLLAGPSGAGGRFDWVVDAIDPVSQKALLVASCVRRGIPVLTVGGAGGRRDGTQVRVGDLAAAGNDALLRALRRALRREHGIGAHGEGSGKKRDVFGIPCVYSSEKQVFPTEDGRVCGTPEMGTSLRMDCASGFGAATFVTGAFGFAAAGEVVRRLCEPSACPGVS
jgi:tRNA A37 threonylcarbamoyladenosine dehydratase